MADGVRCGRCGAGGLVDEVMWGGLAALFCVTCGHREIIRPYRVAPVVARAIRGTVATIDCIVCGEPIESTIGVSEADKATGTAGRPKPIACADHPLDVVRAARILAGGLCSTPGCGRKVRARGMCSACYSRWWRAAG